MERKLILLLMLVMLATPFVCAGFFDWIKDITGNSISNINGTDDGFLCIDSDGGKDYYTKGILIFQNNSGTIIDEDSCVSSQLKEFFCTENGTKFFLYYCLNGCENGICLGKTDSSCTINSDCQKSEDKYCNDSKLCVKTINYKCVQMSFTESSCVVENQTEKCSKCPSGCNKGSCLSYDTCESSEDQDGDGYYKYNCWDDSRDSYAKVRGLDCNDDDWDIKPNAIEICDSIDNNCDGLVDEGCKATSESSTCSSGCYHNKICFPEGMSVLINSSKHYCSSEGFKKEKSNGENCVNNYECSSDNCEENICSPVLENQSIIGKTINFIVNFFRNIFS